MGQKVNPKLLRIGLKQDKSDYESVWYDFKNYSDKILEDHLIRNYVNPSFSRAGVSEIKIFRKSDNLEVVVYVARVGMIYGKNGIDTELVVNGLEQLVGKSNVQLRVEEVSNPDTTSTLIASWISGQIEKRVPFRRAMKMAMQKCLKSGAKGVKVSCSGRLGGNEIARCEWYKEGKIPLHTLRAEIDYAFDEASTTYGKIGVKVWIYKGENMKKKGIEN